MKRYVVVTLVLFLFSFVALAQNGHATSGKEPAVAAEAVAITDDITPPVLTDVASPDYTPEAKKKKIEGQVTVSIVVDKKGDVAYAKVVKGLGYGLDENAILAVKEWKYKPATKNGEPVVVKMEVTVDFFLQG